ncbi:helix-turn-helix domain-containing protein [Henriciella sp.]|uniref:helix-turn-helix domain-containing protein n=1 Tax=Henriciella sp. TaxID=1968823 RepID=UPI00261C1465|nr:helix-turn-helix domain-containing protein [Henriciella sp.]
MNRYEFESAVYESKMDAPAKQVLLYMAHRKNWNEDTAAWPSTFTMAAHTGLSPSTVKRRLAILRETGWLVPTGRTVGRGVVVYDLHVGHPDPVVAQCDTEVGQPGTAEVSVRPTEEVQEQVKESEQEEVSTGAAAPVVEESFSPRKDMRNPDQSSLEEAAERPLTREERRAEREYQEFMAWERRNQWEKQRQKVSGANTTADAW